MRILTAILTNKEIDKFERCLKSVLPQTECLVVCNTLDDDYAKQVETHCSTHPVKLIHTHSTGWPSAGKQSVLDHFLMTDYDYLFLIPILLNSLFFYYLKNNLFQLNFYFFFKLNFYFFFK